MKKAILILCAAAMLLTAAGCAKRQDAAEPAGAETSAEANINAVKTLGDALRLGDAVEGESWNEEYYCVGLNLDGTYYRLVANMTPELYAATEEIDFSDEQRDEKMIALVGDLEIVEVVNINDHIPTQEKLDEWVGKTAAEMLDAGWSCHGYNLNDMEFWMNDGMYTSKVILEGTVGDIDNFNEDKEFEHLTVKSIAYDGVGDSANREYHFD